MTKRVQLGVVAVEVATSATLFCCYHVAHVVHVQRRCKIEYFGTGAATLDNVTLLRKPLLLLLIALPVVAAERCPQCFAARVVGITDGDTVTVVRDDVPERDGDVSKRVPIQIRLFGVDRPERRQPFYQRAKDFTADLVFGKTITIHPRGKHFQRVVADIILGDGRLLTRELVRPGLAWWYERYAPHEEELKWLLEAALAHRRELWVDDRTVAPRGSGDDPWLRRRKLSFAGSPMRSFG